MLNKAAEVELVKQQYRIVGKNKHSAVKTCGWTKKMVRGEGGCYKLTFYGIMSDQCMQMSTSLSCANRCTFCWRGYKAPVSKEWSWGVDEPVALVKESLDAHHSLLTGFKGNDKVSAAAFKRSQQVKHVALSLTGEPIMYPKINEFIEECHKQGISTFLVTNAQYPEQIRDLKLATQLYISIDAPSKTLLKEVDKPLFSDYWERLNTALEYMAEKKYRTCIRLTMIKDMTMVDAKKYVSLILKGDPDFIETKGYMFVGASRQRLVKENMPMHHEVVAWSKELEKVLDDYEIVTEHVPSRAVLLAKKKFKRADGWYTWIDFPKFSELAMSGKPFGTMDYLKKTPKVGLKG